MTETSRSAEMRDMLRRRRQQMQGELHGRIRAGRAGRPREVGDLIDQADAEADGDMERALLEMRVDAVSRIDEALARLDAGRYGRCVECEREIPPRRLAALPFAVRCQACARLREQAAQDGAPVDRRVAAHAMLADLTGA